MTKLAAATRSPILRFLRRGGAAPARSGAPRRRDARRSVAYGAFLFAIATAGLTAATETVKPEWRDPEYGQRLQRVRQWRRERPDRPLVLVFGSCRAQLTVSPAAMGIPDEPGEPLLYNMGYRGESPLGIWLRTTRTLDAGVRPRAVLLVLSLMDTRADSPAETQLKVWNTTFSVGDLRRLAPYTRDPAPAVRAFASRAVNPWSAHADAIASDACPRWQSDRLRRGHEAWETMDEYGWVRFPVERLSAENRRKLLELIPEHEQAITAMPLGAVSDRAIRDTIARCRAEGVAVAACWAPESPAYRAMYPARAWAERDAYTRVLTREYGVPVFPPLDDMGEDEFADGFHLLPAGAVKYSRWLADNHLKPWLARLQQPGADGR